MHSKKIERNPFTSAADIENLFIEGKPIYLITWERPDPEKTHLWPVDYTPLGPYTISEMRRCGHEGMEIRVDALNCDMKVHLFLQRFGGVFESPEHIAAYMETMRFIVTNRKNYLSGVRKLKQRMLNKLKSWWH